MNGKLMATVFCCAALAACAEQPGKQDPLQNTKKLVKEGHADLYNNGAFEIPTTTIHIIPPGPDALDLVLELAKMRAYQSFQESIKHARESIDLAKKGVAKSKDVASAVQDETGEIAQEARSVTRFGGAMFMSSPGMAHDIVAASVAYSGQAYDATADAGAKLAQNSLDAGASLSEGAEHGSARVWAGTRAFAGETFNASRAASGRHAAFAKQCINGYAVGDKLGQRAEAAMQGVSLSNFVEAFRRSNAWRERQSGRMTAIMSGAVGNYRKDVGASWGAAGKEMSQDGLENGYTFALVKSMGWLLQTVFWDATVKPVGKLAGASLGYIVVNGMAVPVLVTNETGAVAKVAVQVSWNAAGSVYDITAPTATATLAGLFSAAELVGGYAMGGSEYVAGALASAGTYAGGKAVAGLTAGGGYVAGKTVQYVGAPLSALGVAAGGSTVGVVFAGGTGLAGAGVAATGLAAEGAIRVGGNAAAGMTLAGGSVASVTTGAALGTYELSKAIVVPAGHEVGAGLVLGYGTLSQLGAQTVLAVSDASYMVLSLEGPKWVLYAVKGNVDNGEELPPGAIVDLQRMRAAGETLIAVPASEEEMQQVINAVPAQLPVRSPRIDTTSP